MTITLIAVGRVRAPLDEAVAVYETRAGRYWKLTVVEVDAGLGRGGRPVAAEVLEAEAGRILGRIPDDADIWALTREGKGIASTALAKELGERALHGGGRGLAICIGGAYGLSPSVLARAERQISLSRMTLPHELARLVFAEQLYRAGTILRGEPYHKGPDR